MIVYNSPRNRAAGAMSPARYLRLRRLSFGLERRQLATMLATVPVQNVAGRLPSVEDARTLLDMLEREGVRARDRSVIERIGAFVPLDADVYFQLAYAPADRQPQVCDRCACSDNMPCSGEDGVCTWAAPNLCTRCAEFGVGGATVATDEYFGAGKAAA